MQMELVPVSKMGKLNNPHSSMRERAVISPMPFKGKMAAYTLSSSGLPAWGQMPVTPVRHGTPCTSVLMVACPTRTPATSVMALSGPVGKYPGVTPKSRIRGMFFPIHLLIALDKGYDKFGYARVYFG